MKPCGGAANLAEVLVHGAMEMSYLHQSQQNWESERTHEVRVKDFVGHDADTLKALHENRARPCVTPLAYPIPTLANPG